MTAQLLPLAQKIFSVTLLAKLGRIVLILFLALISQKGVKKLIRTLKRRIRSAPGETLAQRRKRINTLSSLLTNAANFFISIIALLMILSELGVNLTPFLTGAGIIGLAIGLGMKDLASDLVAGFFILLDNQINIGDQVEIGSSKGKVVKIGLRTITLKDEQGRLHLIPNSNIKTIIKSK
jgi:small conductance mechanosensitive channel